ncbi:MAG: hypothetical protein QOI04_1138 [Verrucomicrobiota bacterium]
MRLVFVTPYYFPEFEFGGPPKRLHAIAKALLKMGHNVRVVTFDSKMRSRYDSAVFDGVNVQFVPWIGTRSRQVPRRVADIRHELNQADLVHGYGLYNLLVPLSARLAVRRKKPFILEPMGMFVPRVRSVFSKRVYNATLTKWMMSKAAAVVATSELEAEELRGADHTTRVVVRRNGIDLEEFRNSPDRESARKRWHADETSQLVFYIGRISAKKNLIELVAAFAKTDRAKLIIAGPVSEPRYRQKLISAIRESARAKDIFLEGPVYGDDYRAALAAADLFVLSSLNENFGNAAAEAVAANVPVLLTETCGVAPIIDRRAGLAVPLGVDHLADGLRRMLDPEFRRQMTARKEEAKKELSWNEPIRQTEELYRQILNEHSAQKC